VVVTGAFTRDVSTLPETCSTSGSDEKTDYNLESSVIDAAMQFKHLFQTFTTLSSTADELKILTETIQVLEVMAAGGKTVSSADGNDGKKESSKTKTQSPAKFDDATVDPIAQFKVCLSVLFGVLFLPNSRPLHRTIVASPRRFPLVAKRMAETILGDAIHEKIRATLSSGETSTSGTKTMTDSSGQGASTLRVLGVLFSVVQCQPQTAVEKRIVRRVAVEAAALIGKGEWFFLFLFALPTLPTHPLSVQNKNIENDEFSFQKLELPSQAGMFGAVGRGPLGAVANGFRLIRYLMFLNRKGIFFFFGFFLCLLVCTLYRYDSIHCTDMSLDMTLNMSLVQLLTTPPTPLCDY
tara:strand:- start:16764 stop:17819 length:1056 start_codon:yes stop_codon:yes gene_type:complete